MGVSERENGGVDASAHHGRAAHVPQSLEAELVEIHRLLSADRERTSGRIGALSQNFSSIVEAAHLTATDDEHDPEGATIAFERSQATALLEAARHHLIEVDAALRKLADGSYGRCERCGQFIAPERLLARPSARTCIDCASRNDRG